MNKRQNSSVKHSVIPPPCWLKCTPRLMAYNACSYNTTGSVIATRPSLWGLTQLWRSAHQVSAHIRHALHADITQLEFYLKFARLTYGWMQNFQHVRILEFKRGIWHVIRKYHAFSWKRNATNNRIYDWYSPPDPLVCCRLHFEYKSKALQQEH